MADLILKKLQICPKKLLHVRYENSLIFWVLCDLKCCHTKTNNYYIVLYVYLHTYKYQIRMKSTRPITFHNILNICSTNYNSSMISTPGVGNDNSCSLILQKYCMSSDCCSAIRSWLDSTTGSGEQYMGRCVNPIYPYFMVSLQ